MNSKITIVHALDTKFEIIKEPSIYAQSGKVYFVPEGILLENTVEASKYYTLKYKIEDYNRSIWQRIKSLFVGL